MSFHHHPRASRAGRVLGAYDVAVEAAKAKAANEAAAAAAAKAQADAQAAVAAKTQAAADYTASMQAYSNALAKLSASWSALPTAPYPPSGDTSSFPRTGTQSLFVSQAQVSAAQLAEPGKVTQGINQQAKARRPKLNGYFFVGTLCLIGYFVVRR